MNNLLLRRIQQQAGGTPPTIPYQRVEYLESSGTQYIDTNYYLNGNTDTIDAIFAGKTNKQWCFGERSGDRVGGFFACNGGNSGTSWDKIYYHYYSNYNEVGTFTNDENQHHIVLNNQLVLDNVVYKTYAQRTFTVSRVLLMFAHIFSNNVKPDFLRIYSYEIYRSSILEMQFFPVRIGTTGYMYDAVSGNLFGNAGTGDFIVGPDIN